MQINIYAGGRSWIVDEAMLINWLSQHAVQAGQPTTVVREVIGENETGRILLNESR